jgi:hypothetical protein
MVGVTLGEADRCRGRWDLCEGRLVRRWTTAWLGLARVGWARAGRERKRTEKERKGAGRGAGGGSRWLGVARWLGTVKRREGESRD